MWKLINQRNYNFGEVLGEVNTKPSMTVPNQTLSLKVLLDRYVVNRDVPVFEGIYDADSDVEHDIANMDVFERLDLAREIRKKVRKVQEDVYQQNVEKQKKEQEELVRKAAAYDEVTEVDRLTGQVSIK